MIITHLLGGLGNQMFQYAAGLALAERRRTVLKLDVTWFKERAEFAAHNRYALSCLNVTEQFATKEEVDRVRGRALSRSERLLAAAARGLRLRRLADLHAPGGNWHMQRSLKFYPEFLELPDDTYLDGMWQSERYFAGETENVLRQHFGFRYPAPPAVAAMAERIRGSPSASVHFRRGDYVTNEKFSREIGVLGFDYYRRALSRLKESHPGVTLYIFSDDLDEVERSFKPEGPHVFVRVGAAWHAYDKIRLMSLCDHSIISNSTFAWWGAWLNPNPRRLVIAPDPWLAGRPDESAEVVPAHWLRLPIGP